VTMADKLSADQAVAASEAEEGLMAGTGRLKVTHFSKDVAKTSTGKMGSLSPRTRKWLTIRCQNADDSGSIVKDKQARVALSPHDIFFTATPADLTSAASIVRRLESALVENEISDGWDGMCLAACEQILDQERNKRLRALVAKQVKVPPSSLRPRVSEAIPPGMAAHGSKTAHPVSQCVRQATATAENGSRDGQDDETSDEDESSDDEFDSDDEDYERQRHYPTIGREANGVRVVVDEGYGSTRFGIAGEDMPTVLSNTINAQSNGNFMHVIERQKLDAMCVDWTALEAQWYHMFETELDVEGENCSVLCTISPYGSLEYAETLGELLFETFDTMGLYFANPSLLSLYAQGKTTGLVVDSGECTTSAFPVYEGMINKHAVKTIPFGGRDITEYIKRELTSRYEGLSLTDYGTHELVRQMKEELCYCGEPRDAPSKCYKLPDGQMLTVDAGDSFPFRAPEFFFFDPLRLDWSDTQLEQSVPSMIFQSVMESPIDARKKLTENVLLAGGNTMFDGLPEMLFKKLKGEGKARAGSLRVNATSVRCHSAWLGGTIVAKMPKYEDQLVTVDEYEEEGPKSVHRHNVLADDMAG
jgi:actin-related protein